MFPHGDRERETLMVVHQCCRWEEESKVNSIKYGELSGRKNVLLHIQHFEHEFAHMASHQKDFIELTDRRVRTKQNTTHQK